MNLLFRRIVSGLAGLAVMSTLIPPQLAAFAANAEQSAYMRYETNYSHKGLDGSFGSYRIWGTVGGQEKQTTYNDEGWRITIKNAAGNLYSAGQLQNGVEKIIGAIGVTENLSLVNNGRYVKIEIAVRNLLDSPQTLSVGSGSDIQIGANDDAPITRFSDGSGFYMTDGAGAQFNFVGKNAYGVTNVDTFWFGSWDEVNANMFNQVSAASLTNTDSGMAFSWVNRTFGANATNRYSVLIGIGALNAPPSLNLSGAFAPGVSLPDTLPGGTYALSGTVTDPENTAGTEVYYAVDDRQPVRCHTFAGTPGGFTVTIGIPADLAPGAHTLSVYVQDADGAISPAVGKPFTVLPSLALTAHDLTYTPGRGPQPVDPDFLVTYAGTINGGRVYIEQNFSSSADSLSFTNSGGITGTYTASNGVLAMNGAATAAAYQSFIRNIKFNSTAVSGTRKIIVTLTTGNGSVLYFSGTGHYYEYVPAPGITWHNAKTAAGNRSYQGLAGYLTTITSAEENAFVAAKCAGNGWLGATDEGHDKQWYWVTGPEADNKFCQQNPYPTGSGISYTVSGWYQNFASGEPNDYPGGAANGENYLHMYANNGTWNDFAYNSGSISGYLVEYGTTPQEASGATASINVTFTDITPPVIGGISGNPAVWTGGDVTLTVAASDSDSGLHTSGAYSFNNGPWTASNSQSFSQNQTVNIRVRDNRNNIASQNVVISKIDKTAPTFTGITQTPPDWTDGGVTLTVTGASDGAGAGLHASAYSFSGMAGVYSWQASNSSPSYTMNQSVYVYVRDALGNISEPAAVNITNIDLTLPNTPVIASAGSYTSSHWYNGTKTVAASFTATPGCAEKLQYSINGGSWTDGGSASLSAEGTYDLKFRVADALGRTGGAAGCVVQIDKTVPGANAGDTGYSWRNSDFYVTLEYGDAGGSGVSTREFALTENTAAPSGWTAAGASESVLIDRQGQWYLHYRVTDNAGNVKTGYYGPYKLDKINPEGSVAVRPDKSKDGFRYVTGRYVTLNFTGSDLLSGVSFVRYAHSPAELAAASWAAYSPSKENVGLPEGDGLKTVYCQLKDAAGNLSQIYSDTVYLDTAAPVLSISAPSGYVAKRGDFITYTVTADDNSKEFGDPGIARNNGIDSFSLSVSDIVLSVFGTIQISDIAVSIQAVAGQPLKKQVQLSLPQDMEGQGSVNLKIKAGAAEDKAGNLSSETLCGFSFSIDNIVPDNQNSIFSGDLRVKGGSVITLGGSSVEFGGHAADSVRFAPASYGGAPPDLNTVTGANGDSHVIGAPLLEGEYYLYVVDSAGNISPPSQSKLTVDNTGPLVTIAAPDKTAAKNDTAVDYLVTFADDATPDSIRALFVKAKLGLNTTGTANALLSIITVGGNERQAIVRLSGFTGDGTINGLIIGADACRDQAGNGSVETVRSTAVTVDCTNPEIPAVTFRKANGDALSRILNFITFGYFWKESIQVTAASSDAGGSGLKRIYYKAAEADPYTAAVPDSGGSITFTLPVGYKGNVWAYAEDGAGNASSPVKSDGAVSENNAPQISVSPADLSPWFNTDTTLSVTVSDDEGLKEIRYSVDGAETVIDLVGGYTDKQTGRTFHIPLTADSAGHIIQIHAVDLAGNVAETYNGTVKLDKTAPDITAVTGNPADWTAGGATLSIAAADGISGLAERPYSFDGGATWQAGNTKTYTENTAGVEIRVKDAAGNVAAYGPVAITKIDKTAPGAPVTGGADNYTADKWYNAGQTVTASFTATEGCDEWLQYRIDDGAWTDGASVSIANEGEYTVRFRVADALGRAGAEQAVRVNLDTTAPTDAEIKLNENAFRSFLHIITFGLFFKDTVDVTITADSDISGIRKIEYQKVADAALYDPDGAWTSGDRFSVQPDEQFIVYARITDKAGNDIVINTNGAVADATNPALSLQTDAQGWAARNITVGVTVSDNLSGVKEVTYTTDEAVPRSGTVAMTGGEGLITLQNEGTYNLTVSAADNSGNTVSSTVGIQLDKTAPVISAVTGNPADWTADDVTLAVAAGDSVSGLAERPYSFDGGATWQAGNTRTYTENAAGIEIRVRDAAGNVAAYGTAAITKIDKTAPVITGVTGNPADWTPDDVTITVQAQDAASGLAAKPYSFDGGATWQSENAKIYDANTADIIVKVKDVTGNIAAYGGIDITKIDKTAPGAPVIGGADSYAADKWYNTEQTVAAGFTAPEGCAEWLQYQIGGGAWTDGDSAGLPAQGKHTVRFRVIDALGRTGAEQTAYVNIDLTAPSISGAADNGGYYIGRVILREDVFGEIESSVYNGGASFPSGTLFKTPGKYVLSVTDKAGNLSTLTFTVKSLPKVETVAYTDQSRSLIQEIRAEFSGCAVLPEPYRSEMDAAVKALEDRYAALSKEVEALRLNTDKIRTAVDGFAGKTDGLIAMNDQVQALYDRIAGKASTLTQEQKAALAAEADYLKDLLGKIKKLSDQVNDIRAGVAKIPPAPDGLIAQKGAIQDILDAISGLTKEQQALLKEQAGHLKALTEQIGGLIKQADEVIGLIKKLPPADWVKAEDAGAVTTAGERYGALNQEQKALVGETLQIRLAETAEALRRLMLHDAPTGITVTGVGGTAFSTDIYLKVTPITEKEAKKAFAIAAKTVGESEAQDSAPGDKELVALYDVSLFKGDQKIQPDGKVQVRIRIPDNLRDREGLDIIYIADDGTVTNMNATREGDDLVFITDHFSQYGVVAKPNCLFGICKMLGQYDAAKGICYDWIYITCAALVIIFITGWIICKRKRKYAAKA